MPTGDDLVGLGMSAQLAAELGNQPSTLVTTGTTQATAAKVLTKNVTLTTAGSATGAVIPSGKIGSPYFFFNPTATSGVIYAPVGDNLNGAASTTGLTLAQNKGAMLWQTSKGNWASILTA